MRGHVRAGHRAAAARGAAGAPGGAAPRGGPAGTTRARVVARAAEEGGPNPVEKAIQQFIDAQPEEVADEDKGPIVYGLCAAVGAFIFVIFAFLLRLPAALGFIVAGGFTGYSCYVASGLLPSVDSGFVAPESYSRQELSEDDQATPEKFKEDEPWVDKK